MDVMARLALVLCGLQLNIMVVQLQESNYVIDLRMQGARPIKDETHLCYARKIPEGTLYIIGIVPHPDISVVHHIQLFSCVDKPGYEGSETWSCAEMDSDDLAYKPICNGEKRLLYNWAFNATQLELPKGVGFPVGSATSAPWIILQVHYKDISKMGKSGDDSGLTLEVTTDRQPNTAGIHTSVSSGSIPAHSTVYMESACQVEHKVPIHPFAFRTHSHSFATVMSGYRVRNGEWTEIGRANPQKPQVFYPMNTPMIIKSGDIIAARCTVRNDGNATIFTRFGHESPMCNYYVMYYVENGASLLEKTYCVNKGPPDFSWDKITRLK